MNVNLLLVACGRRVELTKVLREAIGRLGLAGRIVATDCDPIAPGMRFADSAHVVSKLSCREHVAELLEIARRERISAIFPLIDPEIPILAAHRTAFEAIGARVATVAGKSVPIAEDKWKTVGFFRSLGLAAPRSWLPEELGDAEVRFPLFVKPRCGSASEKTFKVETPEQLAFFCRYVPSAIVQEYLTGPEITCDVVCDLEGEVLAVVQRERIKVRGGEVSIGKTVFYPELAADCVRIAKALPALGPITVQCMVHEGRRVFTEINARLGGGAPCGVAAGADWPRCLVARIAGIPVEDSAPGELSHGGVFLSVR